MDKNTPPLMSNEKTEDEAQTYVEKIMTKNRAPFRKVDYDPENEKKRETLQKATCLGENVLVPKQCTVGKK